MFNIIVYAHLAAICGPGEQGVDGVLSCEPCILGYYKAGRSDAKCTLCPDGQTTVAEESITIDDCTGVFVFFHFQAVVILAISMKRVHTHCVILITLIE